MSAGENGRPAGISLSTHSARGWKSRSEARCSETQRGQASGPRGRAVRREGRLGTLLKAAGQPAGSALCDRPTREHSSQLQPGPGPHPPLCAPRLKGHTGRGCRLPGPGQLSEGQCTVHSTGWFQEVSHTSGKPQENKSHWLEKSYLHIYNTRVFGKTYISMCPPDSTHMCRHTCKWMIDR